MESLAILPPDTGEERSDLKQTSMTRTRLRTVDLAYAALFAVLLMVCAWINIPLTVPFTLQTFGVFAALGTLGGRRGTLAILAYLLQEYSNEPVDIAKVMLMCLIHDIVEIDAGDTYAYDAEGLKTQKAREDAAKERIFSLLPDEQKEELTALFDEFEAYETPESKFAHSMDNLQPLLLNNSNGGGDWREHGVTAEQVYGRQSKTRLGSEQLFEVVDRIIRENIEKGNIIN